MRNYSKLTPEGVRDVLFDECRAHREAQRRLTAIFTRRGYREVITPGLEYYDVFSLPGAAIPQQEMYKSTDSGGRLLVFRPDSTLPIARMAAARLQGHRRPIRLYYSQSVYRTWPELSGRSHESSQMGVELLGAAGLRADLEVIGAAIEAIKAVAGDYRIELGHAGLFRHLVERLDLPPEAREEIRATIEAKNYGALGGLLDPLGNSPEAQALRRLPRLFLAVRKSSLRLRAGSWTEAPPRHWDICVHCTQPCRSWDWASGLWWTWGLYSATTITPGWCSADMFRAGEVRCSQADAMIISAGASARRCQLRALLWIWTPPLVF